MHIFYQSINITQMRYWNDAYLNLSMGILHPQTYVYEYRFVHFYVVKYELHQWVLSTCDRSAGFIIFTYKNI